MSSQSGGFFIEGNEVDKLVERRFGDRWYLDKLQRRQKQTKQKWVLQYF